MCACVRETVDMCVCVCTCGVCIYVTVYMWRSENHTGESGLFFSLVAPRDGTQEGRLAANALPSEAFPQLCTQTFI